jgi:hypothetical protein
MTEQLTLRKRAPLFGDLLIIWLGTWGFLLQCLKSWRAKRSHELESND